MTSKWNGMKIDLSGSKAKITPAPKTQLPPIEIGDYYLITTRDGKEYDNAYVLGVCNTHIFIEVWNEVKDRTDEIEVKFDNIKSLEGFNDSQSGM